MEILLLGTCNVPAERHGVGSRLVEQRVVPIGLASPADRERDTRNVRRRAVGHLVPAQLLKGENMRV